MKGFFFSTKDSMNKVNREETVCRYVFAKSVRGRTKIYNIHNKKDMAKDPKEMNTPYTAIVTQKVDNIIHSENIYSVPTKSKESCSQGSLCSGGNGGIGGRQ